MRIQNRCQLLILGPTGERHTVVIMSHSKDRKEIQLASIDDKTQQFYAVVMDHYTTDEGESAALMIECKQWHAVHIPRFSRR